MLGLGAGPQTTVGTGTGGSRGVRRGSRARSPRKTQTQCVTSVAAAAKPLPRLLRRLAAAWSASTVLVRAPRPPCSMCAALSALGFVRRGEERSALVERRGAPAARPKPHAPAASPWQPSGVAPASRPGVEGAGCGVLAVPRRGGVRRRRTGEDEIIMRPRESHGRA